MEKTYYELYDIPEDASLNQIKKAYRRLALKYHPDKNASNPKYENIFKKINLIYQVLSDIDKRKEYDLKLKLTRNDNYTKNDDSSNRPHTTNYQRSYWENNSTHDDVNFVLFDQIENIIEKISTFFAPLNPLLSIITKNIRKYIIPAGLVIIAFMIFIIVFFINKSDKLRQQEKKSIKIENTGEINFKTSNGLKSKLPVIEKNKLDIPTKKSFKQDSTIKIKTKTESGEIKF